jgi:hypothetical protein
MPNHHVDLEAKLGQLAEEHLAQMSAVPWQSYASLIAERHPAGETFGFEDDGDRYFDLSIRAAWVNEPGGDIRLVAGASTDCGSGTAKAEREAIISRP